MIVPDPTGSMSVIQTPIATLIIGGQDIDGGGGKRGQVPATLPFQDHEGVRKRGLLEQSIQTIEREHPQPSPLGGEMLLTPTGDIVSHLIVGNESLGGCKLCTVRMAIHAPSWSDDRRAFGPPRIIDCTTRLGVTGI